MLISLSFQWQKVAADWMVVPRSFFKLHGVHFRTNAVFTTYVMDRVNTTSVKQDALCKGGFTRVNVRWDSDISDFGDISSHDILPLMLEWFRL